MVNKFNNIGLENYCQEKEITLTKDYSDIKVTGDTIIHGICQNKCGKEFKKNFKRLVYESSPICIDCLKNKTSLDLNYLNKFVKENNVRLIGDYEKITRDTKIKGHCNTLDCKNIFEKNFRYIIEDGGAYCKECVKINKTKKFEDTNFEKYGANHYLKTEEGKNKVKDTVMKKYGVEYTSQLPEIRKKVKNTVFKKYGFNSSLQVPEIKEKIKNTYIVKYGVEHPMQNEEIKKK